MRYAVVLPSIGRPSLGVTLRSLAGQVVTHDAPAPEEVVVVDDRPFGDAEPPAPLALDPDLPWPVRVVRTGGRGPAAARNAGWRSTTTPWVAFVDDDVVLPEGWVAGLAADLAAADADVAGVQGRLHVPLPAHRPPTDWERSTRGLEDALWATADMAYRRTALEAVGGFDERFPRAYREDADLALRVRRGGWRLERGDRTTVHPVRPADDGVSLRVQAGAADDALLRALHGPRWRDLAETGRGRFPWHVTTVAAAAVAAVGLAARRPWVAGAGSAAWLALTADFARRRLAPGPRPGHDGWRDEWTRMAWTSVAIPFAAVRHRVRGALRHAAATGDGPPEPWPPAVRAVLFDRDGTLVHDVPYNGDPEQVRPVDGAREVLDALRARGVRVGVVSNQSGVARGLLTSAQVDAVNRRVEDLLGPFDVWQVCPHGPDDACVCRKPAPGMVVRAAAALGIAPAECAVVGDIGADVGAAVAAGARAVLVPTAVTRTEEVDAAPLVAPDLRAAVAMLGVGP
ncbi:HAD family hydrolase [Cellulomonas carbonis T26]|uniref:D,D-heptose 1,7-bisphosphate phosphatase n=1 Tax=Cellulomonas carbonis T26 TaxID=947969 RepID=A0A0A0BME9_9CELL|nr:HAD family hydrolase [Cellulomonas carbonis T26]